MFEITDDFIEQIAQKECERYSLANNKDWKMPIHQAKVLRTRIRNILIAANTVLEQNQTRDRENEKV